MGLQTDINIQNKQNLMSNWAIVIFISMILIIFPLNDANAQFGSLCFEDVDDLCGAGTGDPEEVFSAIIQPLESQIGLGVATGFGFVIFWAGIFAIVWFKSENIMIIGLLGVFVNATIIGFNEQAAGIGILLLGVANGILLFQMVRQRVSLFS